MFRIFLIAVCFFFCRTEIFAAEKKIQTLEEINADLKAKKKALQPFDDKDVKVDLESLGLDDVDKKTTTQNEAKQVTSDKEDVDTAVSKITQETEQGKIAKDKILPIADSKKSDEKQPSNPSAQQASQPVQNSTPATAATGVIAKIQNFLNKKSNQSVNQQQSLSPKRTTDNYINSAKKQNLKKRIEAEKKKRENEKKYQEKLKKLKDLREQYLSNIEQNSVQQSDENFVDYDKNIIPYQKNLNPFLSEEEIAPPLLDRLRTSDNIHIPIIPTHAENISVLFDSIASGNVAFFNGAYKNVENPNVKNQSGDTILTYATLLQKHAIIAAILAKGADPDLTNTLGYTPVDIAIEMLDIKALELLVKSNADLKYTDSFGRTYLMHAARVGFLPAVELFVSEGVDVNAMDNDGFTALSIAYRHKKEVIVKYLLKNGAKTWIEKPYDPGNQSLIKELESRWK